MVKFSSLIDKRLGRYTLLEKIGSGGMATVFRAHDTNLNRSVAVKLLHKHLADQDGFKERFEREARIIASLNHPNIVQVYDFDVVDLDGEMLMYMVMRYVTDKTLDTLLKEHTQQAQMLSIMDVRRIMLDLCAALSYAHTRGMVHRDIKPSNVLIETSGQAVLTDFGIAKLVQASGLTQEGTIVGTPAYMSPEQATGDVIDGRSDLYSLGIVLFELLTGRTPFEDDNTVSMLLKHIQTLPPRISEVVSSDHAVFDAITSKALAKDPARRYQTADEFADALTALLSTEGSTTRILPRASLTPAVPTSTVTFNIPKANPTRTILRTIDMALLRPARQNPLTFVSLGVAVVALLIVARISQQALPAPVVTPQSVQQMVASMTSDSLFGMVSFAPDDLFNVNWQQNTDGIVTRVLTPQGEYVITNTVPRFLSTSLFDQAFIYDDVQITMDATLSEDSGSTTGYGLVFRYQDSENYNVFAVDGEGRFSLWTREKGVWRELRNAGEEWTTDPAVLPKGQSNKITIIVFKNLLVGYINSQQVVRLQEDTFRQGAIGIYTANGMVSGSSVQVDNYLISRSENPAFSMTDSRPPVTSVTLSALEATNELPEPSATAESTPE